MGEIGGSFSGTVKPIVSLPMVTNPNPKVRKSGAVGKAVLASMVLEEGSIRDARGDSSRDIRIHREPLGWKSCVVRGAPFSLYGLFFGRSFGKVIKAQGGPWWCRGWWSIVSKNRLTANNTEQKMVPHQRFSRYIS